MSTEKGKYKERIAEISRQLLDRMLGPEYEWKSISSDANNPSRARLVPVNHDWTQHEIKMALVVVDTVLLRAGFSSMRFGELEKFAGTMPTEDVDTGKQQAMLLTNQADTVASLKYTDTMQQLDAVIDELTSNWKYHVKGKNIQLMHKVDVGGDLPYLEDFIAAYTDEKNLSRNTIKTRSLTLGELEAGVAEPVRAKRYQTIMERSIMPNAEITLTGDLAVKFAQDFGIEAKKAPENIITKNQNKR